MEYGRMPKSVQREENAERYTFPACVKGDILILVDEINEKEHQHIENCQGYAKSI